MLQHSIQDRNALSGRALAPVDRLSVAVADDCARFSLRVAAEAREAAGLCFGCALPARIGGLSTSGNRTALCLGPDEWVLMAASADAATIAARFATGMRAAHSLVDVSHREVGIEVRGAAARLALSAACALDLEIMPAPSATRTVFDKAQVVLVKYAPDHYRIEVWPSFAAHVWGLLDAAAHEIALGV